MFINIHKLNHSRVNIASLTPNKYRKHKQRYRTLVKPPKQYPSVNSSSELTRQTFNSAASSEQFVSSLSYKIIGQPIQDQLYSPKQFIQNIDQQEQKKQLQNKIQVIKKKLSNYHSIIQRNQQRFQQKIQQKNDKNEVMYDRFIYLIQKQKRKNQECALKLLKYRKTKKQQYIDGNRYYQLLRNQFEESGRKTGTFNFDF